MLPLNDVNADTTQRSWCKEAAGRAVTELRKEAGLEQKELARNAGVSTAMMTLIEKGERIPSVRTKESLADALGCDRQEFAVLLVEAGYGITFDTGFRERLKLMLKSAREPTTSTDES